MQIKHLYIENYRGIQTVSVPMTNCTSFVGENNTCKSSMLKAVELFFTDKKSVNPEDHFHRDINLPIQISLIFYNFTEADRQALGLNSDETECTITREFKAGDTNSGAFYREALIFPPFDECRSEQKANAKKEKYNLLSNEYNLPKISKADEIEECLSNWEAENPERLIMSRTGKLFGFANVAKGKILAATGFEFVPAVQMATDELDNSKSSKIRALISLIAKQTIENRTEFKEFKASADERLKELTDPDSIPSLREIGDRLTGIISKYYADSKLHAKWEPLSELPLSFPSARVEVEDNQFLSSIDFVGHGLQRAALLTVLEFMVDRPKTTEDEETLQNSFETPQSDIIVAIEEPELYQHPSKQRIFYKALKGLTESFNRETGIRFQVLFATHSNVFLDIKDVDNIRVCKRLLNEPNKQVKVTSTTIKDCANQMAEVLGVEPNVDLYQLKLHTFTDTIAEGFFAKVCVLVEGVSDKAILEGFFKYKNVDPVAIGIVISNTEGKTKMDKPITIFQNLEIPCFYIFDNDQNKKNKNQNTSYNTILQKLAKVSEDQLTQYPSGFNEYFLALPNDLESYIKSNVGTEEYLRILDEEAQRYELEPKDCMKSPIIAQTVFNRLHENQHMFVELEQVYQHLTSLVQL